jgi:hypothetical protein
MNPVNDRLITMKRHHRHEQSLLIEQPASFPRVGLASTDGSGAMSEQSGFGRRDFLSGAATGLALAGLSTRPAAAATVERSETQAAITPQPAPAFESDQTTADIIVETLIAWGATHAFGIVGDGINSVIEALRKRQDRIRYIGVRHEEAAAFMASGFAKHTGRLGVCIGTTGPGAIHLLNGLQDAAFDGAPVVALTGLTFHDLQGVRYQQSVDTVRLMQTLALYNEEVSGPRHAIIVANRACRTALGDRGVAHLAISKDVQMMKLAADKPSMRNPGCGHPRPGCRHWRLPPTISCMPQRTFSIPASALRSSPGKALCTHARRLPNWRTRSARRSPNRCSARACSPTTRRSPPEASATSAPRHPPGR